VDPTSPESKSKVLPHYHNLPGSNSILLDCVPWTFPLSHVPAWKFDLLRVLHIKLRLPLLCQKYTKAYTQPPLTRVRTPSPLIVPHEHFLLAMCLHGSLICYVCYILSKDYRYCVKSIQFRVKLVAGYITILVINNGNLLVCQIIFQPPLTEIRTPSTLLLSHERFLLTICLHEICMELIC